MCSNKGVRGKKQLLLLLKDGIKKERLGTQVAKYANSQARTYSGSAAQDGPTVPGEAVFPGAYKPQEWLTFYTTLENKRRRA
jgi:hypothetical protein